MTLEKRLKMLDKFVVCLKCETSGKDCDSNCSIQYEAGNMGEIIENLEFISRFLQKKIRG